MNNNTHTWAQQHRQLRLFISSTFVDMDSERSALTRIFPQIDELCRQRGVEFVPIDLRWGITEDEAKEGRVIETCLREIDDSRPFFIGIIGNRYGWVPTEKDLGVYSENLQQKYPWIKRAMELQMSITEMEMQHAVLMRNDNGNMNAAFYIRSDSTNVDPAFKEVSGSAGEQKLEKLKVAIRAQKKYPVYEYQTVDHLADMVLRTLTAFLDRTYPILNVSSYDEVAERQERMLQSKSKSLFSLERYQNDVIKWIENKDKRDLLITGKIGIGKSYLMADIVNQLREKGEKLVYVDMSEQDNLIRTMEYVCGELLFQMGEKSRRQIEKESNIGCLFSFFLMLLKITAVTFTFPFRVAFGKQGVAQMQLKHKFSKIGQTFISGTLADMVKQLANALQRHPEMRLYVVFDNMDDLSGDDLSVLGIFDGTYQLRILASASLDSNTQLYMQNRKSTEVLQVKNLSVNQAANYVNCYLSLYGKSLDARGEQCGKLMKLGIGGNPLLLSHILKLMVSFGSHEELDNYINELAIIQGEAELYTVMLRHILKQFESSNQIENIKDIITAYAVVKSGLSESEIKEIFNPREIVWAQLRPYLFSIFRCKGKIWKPASNICRNVIMTQMSDRISKVSNKVAGYFENLLHCAAEHVDTMGTVDAMAYVRDGELLTRQVQVLPEMYYERDNINDLYYWLTYIRCDKQLTHEQRTRYWKKMYSSRIYMRNAGDVNIPPYVLREMIGALSAITHQKVLKDNHPLGYLVREYYDKYKWLQSDREDLNAMYNRWARVAAFHCDPDDVKWLNKMLRMGEGDQDNVNDTNDLDALTNAVIGKEWYKVLEIGKSGIFDEQSRVYANMYMGIAYESIENMQNAFECFKSSVSGLERLGLESSVAGLAIIYHFVRFSCKYGTVEDVEKAHSLILLHENREHTRDVSDENSILFNHSMALIHLKKGNKDAAISYAKVYGKLSTTMGSSDKNAQDIIAKAMDIK